MFYKAVMEKFQDVSDPICFYFFGSFAFDLFNFRRARAELDGGNCDNPTTEKPQECLQLDPL